MEEKYYQEEEEKVERKFLHSKCIIKSDIAVVSWLIFRGENNCIHI